MFIVLAALAADPRYKDIIFVPLHPGAVSTDMASAIGATHLTEMTPAESVTAQLKVSRLFCNCVSYIY